MSRATYNNGVRDYPVPPEGMSDEWIAGWEDGYDGNPIPFTEQSEEYRRGRRAGERAWDAMRAGS